MKPLVPHSLILSTATRILLPLMLLFSVYLMLRGHNEPGGGFVGGLVAAAAFALYALAFGIHATRQALRVDPHFLIGLGLAVALGGALVPSLAGRPFLTGLWLAQEIPGIGKLGTPVVFDIGVYLAVLGVVVMIVFALMEE